VSGPTVIARPFPAARLIAEISLSSRHSLSTPSSRSISSSARRISGSARSSGMPATVIWKIVPIMERLRRTRSSVGCAGGQALPRGVGLLRAARSTRARLALGARARRGREGDARSREADLERRSRPADAERAQERR
jgi:hypothetical protein